MHVANEVTFLFSLIGMIEIPYQDVIGFDISINDREFLIMESRVASGPILQTVFTAAPSMIFGSLPSRQTHYKSS